MDSGGQHVLTGGLVTISEMHTWGATVMSYLLHPVRV